MRGALALIGLIGMLLLSACNRGAVVYDLSQADTHTLLSRADELPPVFGSNEPDLRMETADPAAVAWVLSVEGKEVMRFVAILVPEGQVRTAVAVSVQAPPEFEKRLNDNSSVRDLYLAAMREQVDSTLLGRPYDMTRVLPAMQKAMAANIGTIAGNMQAAGEEARKRDEDNIRKAYAREAAGE